MTQEEFRDRYRSLPTERLIRITLDTQAYRIEAVRAAHEELAERQVDDEAIAAVSAPHWQKQDAAERRRGIPVREVPLKPRIIMVMLVFASLFNLYEGATYLGFGTPGGPYPLDTTTAIIALFALGVVAVPALFWFRKAAGWIASVGLAGLSAASGLYGFAYAVWFYYFSDYATFMDEEAYGLIDLFAPNTPSVYLASLTYFAVLLYLLIQPEVISLFRIPPTTRTKVYLVTGAVALALMLPFFT